MGARAHGPFVVLIGESGVGKSTVGVRLAGKLGGPRLTRDDFDNGWRDLYWVLDHSDNAVVECVRIPRALRERMEERDAALIELTVSDRTRLERLQAREVDPDDVEMLYRVRKGPNSYDRHVEPDLSVQTDQDPAVVADEIAERYRVISVGSL